jgi:hypothetical protein
MAVTINATAGNANANSFVTAAEADAYFADRSHSEDWDAADADGRARALIVATRRLEQEQYAGSRASVGQGLSWPRVGAVVDDVEVAAGSVPTLVRRAQMELAIVVLREDVTADTGLEAFDAVSVGPVDVTVREGRQAGALPAHVLRELAPVLRTPPGVVRLRRA